MKNRSVDQEDPTKPISVYFDKSIKPGDLYPSGRIENDFYIYAKPLDPHHKAIVRWLTVILFTGIFAFGGYVMWVTNFATPEMPGVQINSLSISHLNISGSEEGITTAWNWNIEYCITDAVDQMRVFYNDVSLEVLYKNQSYTQREISPFSLENGAGQPKKLTFTTFLTTKDSNRGVAHEWSQGQVTLDINIYLNATYTCTATGFKTREIGMVGTCKDLEIDFLANPQKGKLVAGRNYPCVSKLW